MFVPMKLGAEIDPRLLPLLRFKKEGSSVGSITSRAQSARHLTRHDDGLSTLHGTWHFSF